MNLTMKRTIASLAVAAALTTTAAQATWFNPGLDCRSMEDLERFAAATPDMTVPHTPDELMAFLAKPPLGLKYVEVTKVVPFYIYYGPGTIRLFKTNDSRTGGNAYAIWVNNQKTCFNMRAQDAARKAGLPVRTELPLQAGLPLPFTPQSSPTQPAQSDPYQLDPYRRTHHQ